MDITKKFEEIYKQACDQIQMDDHAKVKDFHKKHNSFMNFIRFNAVRSMFISLETISILAAAIAFASRYSPLIRAFNDIIPNALAVFLQISILFILTISSRANISISANYRWQREAEEVSKLWRKEGFSMQKLNKVVDLRIFYFKQQQDYFLGIIAVLSCYVGLDKIFTGSDSLSLTYYFPYFYSLIIYSISFTFLFVFYVSFVYIPLQRRRQLRENL